MPIDAMDTGGGSWLPRLAAPRPVVLTFEKIAAVIASLVALGPTAAESSASARRALVRAIAR